VTAATDSLPSLVVKDHLVNFQHGGENKEDIKDGKSNKGAERELQNTQNPTGS